MKIWLLRSSSETASDLSAHHTWGAEVAYMMGPWGGLQFNHHHCRNCPDKALFVEVFGPGHLE
jgi:hypothetical protein